MKTMELTVRLAFQVPDDYVVTGKEYLVLPDLHEPDTIQVHRHPIDAFRSPISRKDLFEYETVLSEEVKS